jgi:hypothetical protein
MELVCGEFFGVLPMVMHWPFKNNLKNNYLIFKPNYFIFFLITISFSYGTYTLGVKGKKIRAINTYLTKP